MHEAGVVELGRAGREAGLNVAQALTARELRKGQRAIVLGAAQSADLAVAVVTVDDPSECRPRQKTHDLGE